jgi:hypothetical protein
MKVIDHYHALLKRKIKRLPGVVVTADFTGLSRTV